MLSYVTVWNILFIGAEKMCYVVLFCNTNFTFLMTILYLLSFQSISVKYLLSVITCISDFCYIILFIYFLIYNLIYSKCFCSKMVIYFNLFIRSSTHPSIYPYLHIHLSIFDTRIFLIHLSFYSLNSIIDFF